MVDYLTEQYKSIGFHSLSEALEMSVYPCTHWKGGEGVMLGMGTGVEEIEAA